MNPLEESVVRALGDTMRVDPTRRRVTILIDVLTGMPMTSLLGVVEGVWLEYVESVRVAGPTLIQRYRLTVAGNTVRCAVVQNVIKAIVQGDDTMLRRCVSVANQLSA